MLCPGLAPLERRWLRQMALEEDIEAGEILPKYSSSRWLLWQRKIASFDRTTVLRGCEKISDDRFWVLSSPKPIVSKSSTLLSMPTWKRWVSTPKPPQNRFDPLFFHSLFARGPERGVICRSQNQLKTLKAPDAATEICRAVFYGGPHKKSHQV